MNQVIVISNSTRWNVPFYFPKPPKLSTNTQTFIYTHPYIKIMEMPCDIITNYKRLNPRNHYETFDFSDKENIPSDKENIPPPPPIMLRKSKSFRYLMSHYKR